MIVVTAKRDGFRRCGVSFSKEPTEIPNNKLKKEELEILKAEPMLTVEEVADKKTK